MAEIKATYSDWKLIKTRGVIQLVFEIPASADKVAFAALGGMPNHAEERWFILPNIEAAESEVVQHKREQHIRPEEPDNAMPASEDAWTVVDGMDDPVTAPARAPFVGSASEPSRSPQATPREAVGEPPKRRPVTLAQRAGMLCKDPRFQWYLYDHGMIEFRSDIPGNVEVEANAATAVRLICGVKSRSEILPGLPSGAAFEEMLGEYAKWRAPTPIRNER